MSVAPNRSHAVTAETVQPWESSWVHFVAYYGPTTAYLLLLIGILGCGASVVAPDWIFDVLPVPAWMIAILSGVMWFGALLLLIWRPLV